MLSMRSVAKCESRRQQSTGNQRRNSRMINNPISNPAIAAAMINPCTFVGRPTSEMVGRSRFDPI